MSDAEQMLPSNETEFLADAEAIAARIPDGAFVALPPDYSLVAMDVVRALIRRKAKDLRLLGVPVLGFCADLLIGAGCVAEVETSAVSLGEAGLAPRFTEAVERGTIRVVDATCPMVHSGLQAAEKGVPFMPLRGVIGSDLVLHRADWKTLDNPFAANDPLLVAKAIVPDVALIHARWADARGNVWIGRRRELATIAHAARACYVTVEALRAGTLTADELLSRYCGLLYRRLGTYADVAKRAGLDPRTARKYVEAEKEPDRTASEVAESTRATRRGRFQRKHSSAHGLGR